MLALWLFFHGVIGEEKPPYGKKIDYYFRKVYITLQRSNHQINSFFLSARGRGIINPAALMHEADEP